MTVGQSQFTKNGQQIQVTGGSAAIAQGALALIGGPGVEAWPVQTTDYATVSSGGTIATPTQMVAAALPGPGRQPTARDRLGNVYVAGTNSGGNLVVRKFGPLGSPLASATLDATATSVNGAHLFQLQSGAFACVYARAAGALYFVVFDSALNLIAGPSSVATERASTNVVYHSACVLSGGGFAIAYQTSAGTAVNLVTYSNLGTTVLTATSVQALAGSPAQEFVRVAQLSNGNLAVAYRGTMTAGGVAGVSVTIVTTAGAVVVGPVSLDVTSVLGLMEISVLAGFLAVAAANGTNLIATVLSNAGAVQGAPFSVGNTLASLTYPQVKLVNDGVLFWLSWFSSVANGLYVVSLSTAGSTGVAGSALGGSVLSATTYALDAEIVNGLLAVIAASNTTAGQFVMTVGLPDPSLGIYSPYVRSAPVALGSSAATTGSNGPRLMSGGGGLYQGANPPAAQPVATPGCGDFTVIAVYDQQNSATTILAIQKIEASAIVGVVQKAFAASGQGGAVVVNPGPGDYPVIGVGGTSGVPFNHVGLSPSGTAGAVYPNGAALAGIGSVSIVPTLLAVQPGQCYLAYSSATSIILSPRNGNSVPVAGKPVVLPPLGLTVPNTGVIVGGVAGSNLAASTVYLVALNATGQVGFWLLSVGFGYDSNGIRVVNGNPSWSVVGMIATNGSSQFVDQDGSRWVISQYNRIDRWSKSTFSGNPVSTTPVSEIDASIRNSILTWGDAPTRFTVTGAASVGGSGSSPTTGIGFDGITAEVEAACASSMHTSTEGSATNWDINFSGAKEGLTPGLHYATLLAGASNPGTQYYGAGVTVGTSIAFASTIGLQVQG